MKVEYNSGILFVLGLVFKIVGMAVNIGSINAYRPNNGAMLIGALLLLVGFVLIVTAITKVMKNVEVTTRASVSAENHLRDIRNVTVAQYNEGREVLAGNGSAS